MDRFDFMKRLQAEARSRWAFSRRAKKSPLGTPLLDLYKLGGRLLSGATGLSPPNQKIQKLRQRTRTWKKPRCCFRNAKPDWLV